MIGYFRLTNFNDESRLPIRFDAGFSKAIETTSATATGRFADLPSMIWDAHEPKTGSKGQAGLRSHLPRLHPVHRRTVEQLRDQVQQVDRLRVKFYGPEVDSRQVQAQSAGAPVRRSAVRSAQDDGRRNRVCGVDEIRAASDRARQVRGFRRHLVGAGRGDRAERARVHVHLRSADQRRKRGLESGRRVRAIACLRDRPGWSGRGGYAGMARTSAARRPAAPGRCVHDRRRDRRAAEDRRHTLCQCGLGVVGSARDRHGRSLRDQYAPSSSAV